MFGLLKSVVANEKAKKEFWALIQEYLADGFLSAEEKTHLEKTAKILGISESDIQEIYIKASGLSWNQIISDGKITEDEKKTFEGLLDYFNVKPEETRFNQKEFNKYYTLGLIDNGILPNINTDLDLILKKGEQIHWVCSGAIRKHKTITHTQRVGYSGISTSVRIAPGLRYRVGSYKPIIRSSSQNVIIIVDSGSFYVTNQRCGFMGNIKNFSVPINKIAYVRLNSDGLLIAKVGRETPYVIWLDDYEVPAAELSLLLNQNINHA